MTYYVTRGHIRLMVTNRVTSSSDDEVAAPVGRRERRRQETSEKLFIAAMELFSSKGFAHTKVEDITQRADVGKGTFFNYFPSKEHVLGYLVSKQRGTVERHLVLAREGKMRSEEVLTSLARDLIRVPSKSPHLARSILTAFLGNIEVREYMVREISSGRQLIADILRLGQERGELLNKVAPAELARVFQQALFGTLLLWSLDSESSLERQVSATMRMFLAGSSPSPARREVRVKAAKRERKAR